MFHSAAPVSLRYKEGVRTVARKVEVKLCGLAVHWLDPPATGQVQYTTKTSSWQYAFDPKPAHISVLGFAVTGEAGIWLERYFAAQWVDSPPGGCRR